ncbi:Holliday junction resolvase Hjc [Thermococcus sp.]|uniref:Holliday junction resolvase Hjc n=1 Tax=Thermococcus sp. TaxID=35749 RepID=UPI00262E87E8|nr:Holliday junction resolvase Hjc [Thermococcus sp.]
MKYRRGANAERELAKLLERAGFAVVRSAGSHRVDLIAGNGEVYLCIEVKSTGEERLYVPKEDVEKLTSFSERFGGKPLLAIKFKGKGWRLFHPETLTPNGKSYRIEPSMDFLTLEEIIGKQPTLLEVLTREKA